MEATAAPNDEMAAGDIDWDVMPHWHRWNQYAARYRAAVGGLNIAAHLMPLNWREEAQPVEDAYRRGRQHQPRYQYHQAVPRPNDQLRRLCDDAGQHAGKDPVSARIAHHCHTLVVQLEALGTHRAQDIDHASELQWGPSDPTALDEGRATLASAAPFRPCNQGPLDAWQLATMMRDAVARAGMELWQVNVVENMAARASAGGVQRALNIRSDGRFTLRDAQRLIIHEIGGHAMRQENAAHQPLAVANIAQTGYLHCEEGLALWLEEQWGLATDEDKQRYSLRHQCAELARHTSFADVYAYARQWQEPHDAYQTVLRVRLGIADQHNPGAYSKDKVYLEGVRDVTAHLEAHREDLDLLLGGKVSLDQVQELRRLAEAGLWVAPRHRSEDLVAVPAAA